MSERHQVELASNTSQIALARRVVRAAVHDIDSPHLATDAQLVVSELVATVIEHSSVERILMTIDVDESSVAIAVATGATRDELGSVDHWNVPAVDAVSGRGLGMVREVADEVWITDSERGAVVNVTLGAAVAAAAR